MSRQWNDYSEDVHRLPAGMTRVAYDAQTRQYTFRDGNGEIYLGSPGEEYGTMVPAQNANPIELSKGPGQTTNVPAYKRPVIYAEPEVGVASPIDESESDDGSSSRSPSPSSPSSSGPHRHGHERGMTFADILPPHLITSAPASPTEPGFSSEAVSPSRFSMKPKTSAHIRAASAPNPAVTPVHRDYPTSGKGSTKLRATARALGRSFTAFKRGMKGPRRDEYAEV
ncbi:hypothetical protein BV25DRAFT_1910971 [Artomyces pyxidatus]|uniref:Uncharacterized protein n=1 Tax=Artomyces pyxidatus TaxID=48021 RepID=A0ACB8TLK6_9AGAM|nr:hypothetical protein BV25DRAFT_1910971 [Artomyces pyxidatus]